MKYEAQEDFISIPVVVNIAKSNALSFMEHKLALSWRVFIAALLASDSLMILLGFKLAYFIRFQSSLPIFRLDVIPSVALYQTLALLQLPVWMLIFFGFGLYNRQNLLGGTNEAKLLFNAVTVCVVLVIAADFLWAQIALARGWLLVSWGTIFFLSGLSRLVVRLVIRKLRAYGLFLTPALIVGANTEANVLAEQLYNAQFSGLSLVGFVDGLNEPKANVFHGMRILGGLDELDDLINHYKIEELILASSALQQDQVIQIFNKYGLSKRINIRLSTGLYQIITTGLQVNEFAGVPLVKIDKVRLTGLDNIQKIIIDYSIAILALILLLPIFLLIAFLVRLDSPGSIFYRRRVMGVNGHQFDAFKFRTMRPDGDKILEAHPELREELDRTGKLKADPRITQLGALLRKTSLDELPQLINVLRNEMSIVGPRMISPPEMAIYKQLGINLLTVKPGITGLWQVSGRSDVSYDERIRLDMYYIRNWSIWLDLQLLLRTLPAVLTHRGAY